MALAIVVGGINVANIVGVPLGTAVGTAFGWRAAFVMVGLIALAAFVAIALFVPEPPRGAAAASALRAPSSGAARTAEVLTSYALIVLHMMAFWSLSPSSRRTSSRRGGVGDDLLPLILFAFGLAGGARHRAPAGATPTATRSASLTLTYPLAAPPASRSPGSATRWWWPLGVVRHRARLDGRQPRGDRGAEPHPLRRRRRRRSSPPRSSRRSSTSASPPAPPSARRRWPAGCPSARCRSSRSAFAGRRQPPRAWRPPAAKRDDAPDRSRAASPSWERVLNLRVLSAKEQP